MSIFLVIVGKHEKPVPAPSSGIPGGGFQAKTNYILIGPLCNHVCREKGWVRSQQNCLVSQYLDMMRTSLACSKMSDPFFLSYKVTKY